MGFGFFDNKNREYVITNPNTPLPWINYLGNSDYCALISNTAGGYSFYKDPCKRRITRYRYDNIPFDSNGRYLYIRDNKTGKFFSPTYKPVQKKLDSYECRHGLGYTKIKSTRYKIQTEITYFVPLGENLEIWQAEITNQGKQTADLTVFSFIEFCLWDAVGDSANFQRTWSIGRSRCEDNTIIHDTLYKSWVDLFAYFSCSEKIDSYDCQRNKFLGEHGNASLAAPLAVREGRCSNSSASGWAPCGSHCIKIKLKPGEKKTIVFILGVQSLKSKADTYKKKINTFSNPKRIKQELDKLKKYWGENLSKFKAETPDENMNTMLNIWNQYQCMQTFNWSRYASYFESGIGRGIGFRDSCQDTLGFCHIIPEKVKARILDLAAVQFEEGSAYHQYSPLTKKGALHGYSDDALWLVFAAVNYIKQTGDFAILKNIIPYAKYEPLAPVPQGHHEYTWEAENHKPKNHIKKGSLLEHLLKAVEYSWNNRGPHGLPRAEFSDWNDCLNMTGPKGQAESVLVGEMLVKACGDLVELLEKIKINGKKIRRLKLISANMKKTINRTAWDGAWYRRAFDDSGRAVGSRLCKEGKIFLETQPWAVFSGAAEKGRAVLAMDSVYKKLFSEHGIILQQPALSRYYPEYGEISTYPAGLKENASIFCHPNPWAIIAECLLKRGNRAFDYYRAILPPVKAAETRLVEPYVYCQMIAGPDHPDFGEGKNSWLTGTAAWNFTAAARYILGIRPEYGGLVIDPCIPSKWKEIKITATIHQARYIIYIYNPGGVQSGVASLEVDGKACNNNQVEYFKDGKTHNVKVVLG